jgi:hypothetical protein
MGTAWLFLGDVAERAAKFPLSISKNDIVLLGPSRPMLKPFCQWQGAEEIEVDVLGQEDLSPSELDDALLIINQVIQIIKQLGHDYDSINRPWWLFRGIYLWVSLNVNAIGKIALKKWLLRRRPDNVVVIREYEVLTCADFSNADGDGPDNVLSFAAIDLCQELSISCQLIEYNTLKHKAKRFLHVTLYSSLVSYIRLLKLPIVGIKERLFSSSKQERQGGVIFFSRGLRFTELFEDLIQTCPSELFPQILLQQSLTKENRKFTVDIPYSRLEKFSRFRDVLETIFRPSKSWYPEVSLRAKLDKDPLAPGFIQEYLKRVSIHARAITPYKKCVARAISSLKPCLIIAGDDPSYYTHTLLEIAKSSQIPTISLQHGDYSAAAVTIYNSLIEDLYLARSEEVKEAFISLGVSEKKLALYTPKKLGNFFQDKNSSANDSSGLKKVVILGTRLGASGSLPLLVRAVSLLLQHSPALTIEYRPHPTEPILNYEGILDSQGLKVKILPTSESLSSQVKGASCVLVICSSVALQVAIMGIPVVVYTDGWLPLGYTNEVFVATHSLEEAVKAVQNFLKGDNLRQSFYKSHIEFIKKIEASLLSPDGNDWWLYIRKQFSL